MGRLFARFERWTLWRDYLSLGALVLLVRVVTALPIERAGYMDASYTLLVGESLARGDGFTEQVLWNYLDSPTDLPHPSNLYWMPLPGILAAGAFLVLGITYHAAQVPFILLSVIPPLIAFYLAWRLFSRVKQARPQARVYAWMAGLLTTFSGFYTIYWIAPDNFTPFAVTADLALALTALAMIAEERTATTARYATFSDATKWHARALWLGSGIFMGLAQLSRADGFLLLLVVPVTLFLSRRSVRSLASGTFFALIGFGTVISPWLLRNYAVAGSLLAAGGLKTLFLTGYDELFRYNTGDLTLVRYVEWGIANIVGSKLNAFGFDLLVLLFGGLQVFLAPFAIIGLWQLRERVELRPFMVYLVLLISAMTLLFTFPGMRGSMLHSSIALIPFFAVAVPPGLDASIRWVARRRRKWNENMARSFFRTGFVALAVCLSFFLYSQGVYGFFSTGPASIPLWNLRDGEYASIGNELDILGVPNSQPVMTVDPPSFFNETDRRSIYLPTESTDAIFQAARQFDAHFLVLENDHPIPLNALYGGRSEVNGLKAVASWQDSIGRAVVLYRIGD